MGSFTVQPESGATYIRKMALQNMELKRNIANFEKDLNQTLGRLKSTQKELRRSMMAYTQRAKALKGIRPDQDDVTMKDSHIRRIPLRTFPVAPKKFQERLPALGRPLELPKPQPPGELTKKSSTPGNDKTYAEDFMERSHTIPPVRKSADIKVRRRSQDVSNDVAALPQISQKTRLADIKSKMEVKRGDYVDNSATFVAWEALKLRQSAADDGNDDVSVVETASTTAVAGDVVADEIVGKRKAQTKKLLRQAIDQLKDMENQLKLPPIKRKNRLKFKNPFDAIPESEENPNVISLQENPNVRKEIISDLRNPAKNRHKSKRYVPKENSILESEIDNFEDNSFEQTEHFPSSHDPKDKFGKKTPSKHKKIRFLKAT